MPIVSRTLRFYRPQVSGRARVREVHTDALGIETPIQYLTTNTEAEVVAVMNARDMTQGLVSRDVSEVIQWVEARNPVSTFDFTNRDINEDTAEEEVAKAFARRPGDTAIRLAWWIESLNPPTWNGIASRLGWSTAQGEIGERVQTRGQNLTVAEPDYDRTESV